MLLRILEYIKEHSREKQNIKYHGDLESVVFRCFSFVLSENEDCKETEIALTTFMKHSVVIWYKGRGKKKKRSDKGKQ